MLGVIFAGHNIKALDRGGHTEGIYGSVSYRLPMEGGVRREYFWDMRLTGVGAAYGHGIKAVYRASIGLYMIGCYLGIV